MNSFREIKVSELPLNPFLDFNHGTLVLAGDEKQSNALCLSNATLGTMWEKSVVTIGIKPLRYTKEFVDLNETFSINFFDDNYQTDVYYIGSISGRDTDKMKKSNLKRGTYKGTPFFTDANIIVFCKKLFAQEFKESEFLDREILNKFYVFKDYHTIYIAEIEKVLVRA